MKLLNKVCSLTGWKQYLLIGMMANGLLSILLQAIFFAVSKSGISIWTKLGLDAFGVMIGILFWVLSLEAYRKQEIIENDNRAIFMAWLYDGVILLFNVTLLSTVPRLLFQCLGFWLPVAAMIASSVFFLLLAILCLRSCLIFAFDLQTEEQLVKRKYIWRRALRLPRFMLATIGIFLWFVMGEAAVDMLFLLFAEKVGNSFLLQLANVLIVAIGNAFILMKYLHFAYVFRGHIYLEESPERDTELHKVKNVFVGVVTVAEILLAVVNDIYSMKDIEAVHADEYIAELMDYAAEEIKYERVDEAVRIYALVEAYLDALSAYADENEDMVARYMMDNPDDYFYWRLYYSLTNDVSLPQDALLDARTDTRLCHDILRYYKELQSESKNAKLAFTDEENKLIEDCIWICISEGAFVDSTMKFHEDSLRNRTINDMKELYEDRLMYNDLMQVLQAGSVDGYVDEETAYQLLELANANPGNMTYQFMAVMGASQYMKDDASHYGLVVECARRLDSLLEEENRDVSALVEEKLYLAQMVMQCSDYNTALGFLEDVRYVGNSDVEDNIIVCYSELNDNESVIEYAEQLREHGADRGILDYMEALSYLKLQDVDNALEKGVHLAEKVVEGGEERENNNALLYSLAEYLCISDSYKDYIAYHYRVTDYTEDQLAVLRQSVLLENYVKAMDGIYNEGDFEGAISALDVIEKEVPNLSRTWFLKGTIYFNEKEYDQAIDCFNKCIAIDATNTTAVYCLAVLYDIKGDYETSARLCEQILNIMPEVNHAMDWYGVSYHTRALYEALQKHIGGTK